MRLNHKDKNDLVICEIYVEYFTLQENQGETNIDLFKQPLDYAIVSLF